FPCVIKITGKGPSPSGAQTRPFRGMSFGVKSQKSARLSLHLVTKSEASTVGVCSSTWFPNSSRCTSVPLPYVKNDTSKEADESTLEEGAPSFSEKGNLCETMHRSCLLPRINKLAIKCSNEEINNGTAF